MKIFVGLLFASFIVTSILNFINGNHTDARLDLIFASLLVINERIGSDKR